MKYREMWELKLVKRASQHEKYLMQELAKDETEMAAELHQPETDEDRLYRYELENHRGYQLTAYDTETGEVQEDGSYHVSIMRCSVCKSLVTLDGGDFAYCNDCGTTFEEIR